MDKNEWDGFDYELGISEEETDRRFREAVRLAKEKSRIMGKTTCEYDRERGLAYLLFRTDTGNIRSLIKGCFFSYEKQ